MSSVDDAEESDPSAATGRLARCRRRPVDLVLTLLLAALASTQASAHSGTQSYLFIRVFDDGIDGRLEFPIGDLNRLLDADVPDPTRLDDVQPAERGAARTSALARFQPLASRMEAYLDSQLRIGPVGGKSWQRRYSDWELLGTESGGYLTVRFDIVDLLDPPPRSFEVQFDAMIEALPNYSTLLLLETDWQGGVFNNQEQPLLTFREGHTRQRVDLDEPSFWAGIAGTIGLGIDHFLIGTDHLLFIVVLLLPAVLVFRETRWWPAASFLQALWRVVLIATLFALAHSLTLTLAGLGFITLDARWVEVVIAISIILAALHNLRPLFANQEHWIAFGFGLFHGLGFAGLLGNLGLDRTHRFWSMFGFNLGVEIGQIFVILLAFPILFLLRRTPIYQNLVLRLGSVVIAVIAFGWMLERWLERSLGVDRLVDKILWAPRVYGLIALAAGIAVALWYVEKRRGRLLPCASATTS